MHSWPFADFGGDNKSPSPLSSRCGATCWKKSKDAKLFKILWV